MGKEIRVYTRPGCLFCQQVQRMLKESGISFQAVHVADSDAQSEIIAKVKAKSFPLVFVGTEFVGGFTQIVALHSEGRLGELTSMGEKPVADAPQAGSTGRARPNSFLNMARAEIAGYAAWGEYRKKTKT